MLLESPSTRRLEAQHQGTQEATSCCSMCPCPAAQATTLCSEKQHTKKYGVKAELLSRRMKGAKEKCQEQIGKSHRLFSLRDFT